MSKKLIISPVSIDLGAKNTGVYFAHYPAGSSIEDIEKDGKVYQLERDNYTLLMTNRTAKRHQRRGYDRRQMVKRLFKLIWVKHFGLEWDKNVHQTTSFLFNRRGFSFLSEEYNADILSRLPEEVYQLLPNELRIDPKNNNENNNEYDFASALTEWGNVGETKVQECFDAILTKAYYEKIRRCCKEKNTEDDIKEGKNSVKLGDTPKDIFNEIFSELSEIKNRIETEEYTFVNGQNEKITAKYNKGETLNILSFINNNDIEVANAINEKLPHEQNDWLFNPVGNFDLEKSIEKLTEPENIDIKLHLKHLAFALHKILNELKSGGRHRSKYFEEVSDVLGNKTHAHNYLKEFCINKLQSGSLKPRNASSILNVDSLANLISHLSNLELKPLRKYFNDEKHKTGDYWDEARLNKIFGCWILREWRINPEKDKQKGKGKEGDYKRLCSDWKTHQGGVVDFWLKTRPLLTIPPYQDNNNRRPPRCQSLVLNPTFLDNNYADWQWWLENLKELPSIQEHLGEYEDELKSLKGGNGRPYFSNELTGQLKRDSGRRTQKDLDARILQFIFDRVKADDPLNLNEIYSQSKKYRQLQSTEKEKQEANDKLEEAINISDLPDTDTFKTPRDYQSSAVFEQDSFLHLVCNYYKIRQRARDGRVFIHPEYRYVKGRGYENTGRFDDDNLLLTYCNHKPRQKRYQMLGDLAGLLQVAPKVLEKFVDGQGRETTDVKLFNWLNSIVTLKTNCDKAAQEQKKRRGRLREDIRNVFGLIYYRGLGESPSSSEIKRILRASRVNEASNLYNFCNRAKSLCLKITEKLYDAPKQQEWNRDLNKNPATAVYLLAQINNLAFNERSGNANTCVVCSTDNAQRMQQITSEKIKENHAKTQRLPAIATRLIDGAVMRMARIVGDAIAEDKWQMIEGELRKGNYVRVPIITESNRFEFEPNLNALKGRRSNDRGESKKTFNEKKNRIKLAGASISPYSGEYLGESGDLDHIIPRSHEKWGTLNDEANLIFTSETDNRNIKGSNEYSLNHLHDDYKCKQFDGTTDNQAIEKWIIEQIGDADGEDFKFGPYRSFINLTSEQQKAFRHALFLVNHPLREKVVNAIDHRTRTLVNGTQRYFAETLANGLYKKAKVINKQHLLSFDYFGVEAQDNTRGEGIYNLRDDYEKTGHEISKFNKREGEKQQAYSHLIDAQLAFAIIADAHKNDGGFKLKIHESYSVRPVNLDRTILDAIRVKPENMQRKELKRRKTYTAETHHREMITKNNKPSINYQIHRDSIFKESFFPLLKLKDGKIKKGFNQSNCVIFNANEFSLLQENDFIRQTSSNDQYEVWNILKKNCQQFLMKIGAAGATTQEVKIAKIIDKLTYQTIKKPLEKVLDTTAQKNKPPKTVGEALERWNQCIKEKDFKKDEILLPAYSEWLRLRHILSKESKEKNFHDFVKNSSLFTNNQSLNSHNKVRKVFSLPVKSDVGSIRLQRKSWDKISTIQVVADKSLAKYGYDGKDRPHTIISKHSVPRNHYSGIPDSWDLDPLEWKVVPVEEIKPPANECNQDNSEIIDAKIINKDANRCMVRLTVSSIENLSLPQDKSHWKGKVLCYENDEKLNDAQKNDRNSNQHHCLSSQWKWFRKPFDLPKDRREVEIETNPDGKVITFTVSKSNRVKIWLSG